MALAVLFLAACASEELAQAPPTDVDFSGHWQLNEADSDDPQRMLQAQFNQAAGAQNNPSRGSGGRGGRQGGGRGGGDMPAAGPGGPIMPSVGAMGEGLRWPGKLLDIKQVAGVVAFTSGGASRVCQPMDAARRPHHRPASSNDRDTASGRAAPPRARDTPPPRCGWAEKTLIVKGGDADDDRPPFEEHYSLSDDKQRLVEVVGFTGGRSSGFTMSRVWDRQPQ
ncbi:MAG: hypothetical protein ABJC66_03545 [Gammaproteobacteria bacterium]